MTATILIVVLIAAGFVLSLYFKRFASNPFLFVVVLACAVYLVADAIKAWMGGEGGIARTMPALVAIVVVGSMLYRRSKGGRGS